MSITQTLQQIKTDVDKNSIWRRLRRNISISLVGSGLFLAIKLGQTALLTNELQIDDYGRLLLVVNFFVFLDSFFGLRVNDVMFRFFPYFKEGGETQALKGLLLLCFIICLASGVIIYAAVFILSPLLADRLYPNLGLTPLFRIYGCTILFSSFAGLYEPVLRIHDRFKAIVGPQILGSVVTLILLCIYFATLSGNSSNVGYSLEIVVAAFAVGALIQSVVPLIKALRLVKPFLAGAKLSELRQSLSEHWRAIRACLLNSNLSGYLKVAIAPGDVFLLGLFSTPTQLALYGLAKQLTAPLALLQTNIQTAVTPEISSLVAKRKFDQLKRLLAGYFTIAILVGSFLLIGGVLMGHLLIVNVLRPEYTAALPVFYLLTVASALLLVFLVFRPLAVSLDLLRWLNLALLASAALVVIFIVAGELNALTLAAIQLVEVLIFRALFGFIVANRLGRLASAK